MDTFTGLALAYLVGTWIFSLTAAIASIVTFFKVRSSQDDFTYEVQHFIGALHSTFKSLADNAIVYQRPDDWDKVSQVVANSQRTLEDAEDMIGNTKDLIVDVEDQVQRIKDQIQQISDLENLSKQVADRSELLRQAQVQLSQKFPAADEQTLQNLDSQAFAAQTLADDLMAQASELIQPPTATEKTLYGEELSPIELESFRRNTDRILGLDSTNDSSSGESDPWGSEPNGRSLHDHTQA